MERTETPAQAKAAGEPKSPFLWPPHQRPTLQLRNVAERLPKDQQEQTKSLMRAAWRLEAKEGMAKLEKLRNGWKGNTRTRPTACGKEWRNASQSIGWTYHLRYIAAWPAPT
jgi:hypothetical protein